MGLFRLQQVDRQMDQNDARMNAIRSTLENDAEVQQAIRQVDEAREKHRAAEGRLRAAEQVRGAQQIKIEQAESSLYGGTVHNPKELQDLQNDVAALKRHLATLEERQLEAMLELDDAEQALKEAEDGDDPVEAIVRSTLGYFEAMTSHPRAVRLLVEKGSVCVDGVSLTVASVRPGEFAVNIIPHTWENTNLKLRRSGDNVNIEYDLVVKAVQQGSETGR